MTDTQILVVEDQRAVAGALRMRLRGLGYDVLDIAKDGNEAIEKAGSLHPDLILMDIRLGDGIDGIEAARRIRSRFDIPVVYVTAYADNDLLDRARATHPAGFINKPFTTKDLLTTINLAIHRQGGVDEQNQLERHVRDAVVTTDRDGRISFLSSGAEQLTGWSRQSLVGQPLSTALTSLYPLSHAQAEQLVLSVIDGGEEHTLYRNGQTNAEIGDILSALTDANGTRFGVALRFDGYTVESTLAVLQRQADASRHLLNQVPNGALLMDTKLLINHSNAAAVALIARCATIEIVDNRLVIKDEQRASEIHQTLRQITEQLHDGGRVANEGELLVLEEASREDGPHVVAVATAVPASNSITDVPMVAMTLFDLRHRAQLSSSVLQRIYGLTRSEVRLVQHLVGGCSLEVCAQELGISVNTARTHLKHIFHKTGAKRQSELIHQIETGPASLNIEIGKINLS